MDPTAISEEDFLSPKQIQENAQKIQEYLGKGRTLQDALDISPLLMQKKYEMAVGQILHHDYMSAVSLFSYLAVIDPYDVRYWIVLGAANALGRQYTAAFDSFAIARLIDPDDPQPYLMSAYCLQMAGEQEDAKRCLAVTPGDQAEIEKMQASFEQEKITLQREQKASLIALIQRCFKTNVDPTLRQPERQDALAKQVFDRAEAGKTAEASEAYQDFCTQFCTQFGANVLRFSFSFLSSLTR